MLSPAPIWIDECWLIERQHLGNWMPHMIGSIVSADAASNEMDLLLKEQPSLKLRVRKYVVAQKCAE